MSYGRWLSRYGSAIPQWSNVEASMAFHYSMTLQDIWNMSWRRFVILFDALWPRKGEDDEQDDGNQKFDVISDWNKLTSQQPSASKPKELTEYLKEQGIGTRYH